MTTAARPTWAAAKGGNEQGGTRIFGPSQKHSSRDLASHTTLKPRKESLDTEKELQKRNLREELEERERQYFNSKDKSVGARREVEDRMVPRSVDADDSDGEVKDADVRDTDDNDEDDDTEALLAELERIKKERAEENLRKERQQQEEELKAKEAKLTNDNPLININNSTSFRLKRRWDDDVVFTNQARWETKVPKRFINDTIRNDFHRKFSHKYIK